MIDFGWIADHVGAIAGRIGQHLEFAAIALIVGFVISFGLAVASLGRPRVYALVTVLSGIVYTIPSLALFFVFVSITGLSLLTAEIPLVLYTFLIYVRNIVLGFESVPADVIDAANGMGFSRAERFRRVELPIAVPLIIAGVRLASVSTIALVTITATLGVAFGGLGFFLFERPFFFTEVLVGAVGSIAIAVGVDVLFTRLERRLTPWSTPKLFEARGRAIPFPQPPIT
ncbi:MAG TPA: ABC transporter permease [Candidatus Limnocylindrales bacterium]|nr:ABC transporter permease [Candidatus Limnocylindrales bacterium]